MSKMSKEDIIKIVFGILYVLILIMFIMMWVISDNQIQNHNNSNNNDKKEVSNNLINLRIVGIIGTMFCIIPLLIGGRAYIGLASV